MVEHLHSLTPRPKFESSMTRASQTGCPMSGDSAMGGGPLSDSLKTVRLTNAALFDVEAPRLMGRVIAAAGSDLAEDLPGADHMIADHVVTAGRCSGTMAGEEAVALEAGEAIVFTNGDPHIMSSGPGIEAPATKQVVVEVAATNQRPFYINSGGDEPVSASLVCGYFACDARPFNPLLENLPRVIKAADTRGPASLAAVPQSSAKRAGSETVLGLAAGAG
jgi:Cupin